MGVIQQEVFPMSWEQIQQQYKRWNTDPKKVKECEKILLEWYRKQAHLPEKLPFDNFIEKAFVMCCFRMELCKRKIENNFSYKNYYNDLYDVFNPNVQVLLRSECPVTLVPMPKLGPHLDRIWVGFLESKNLKHMNQILESSVQSMIASRELCLRYEKSNSITVVADCTEYGNNFYLNRDFLKTAIKIALYLYHTGNVRVVGVHLINLNPMWSIFLNMLSTFVPQKLMKRAHIHDSYESLYKVVSKEYLPKEFGGTQPSTCHVLEKWDTLFLENQKYLLETRNHISDENKRIGECQHNAMFGVEGSFRKLEID